MSNATVVYDLGTVLSVTTGFLLTKIGNVYEILNYMTGDTLFTHQLPRVMREMAPVILEQHPQLEGVDASHVTPENWSEFMEKQKEVLGDSFPIQPCSLFQHKYIDPMEEAEQMAPGKVVGVTPDIVENKPEMDRLVKHLKDLS